jgi:hypothetical protein
MPGTVRKTFAFEPLIMVFIAVNVACWLAKQPILRWKTDPNVVLTGNFILFTVSFISLYLSQKAMLQKNSSGFLRNTYGSFLLKLVVGAASVAIYAISSGKNLNKNAIFVCMALYFVYTLLEKTGLMRWIKTRVNG